MSVRPHDIRSARTPRRGAYTLLEALLSTVITSIIMGAMLAVILMAAHAVGRDPTASVAAAGDVADQISTDLSLAQGLPSRETNAVTVTVPDRDGDGQPETIRYSWSGTPGDPLMRQYNASPAAVLADNVHRFGLSYLLKTVAPQSPGGGGGGEGGGNGEEGEETLLIGHDDAPGGHFHDYRIRVLQWAAQYFKPTLPADAVSWKITRVMFRARRTGVSNDGTIVVQIRDATPGGKPGTNILADATYNESALGSQFEWVTVMLGPVSGLDPTRGYCLVVKYGAGLPEVTRIEYEDGGSPMTPNTHWLETDTAGFTWSDPTDNADMRFHVYGTVTTGGS